MKKIISVISFIFITATVSAGGDPDYVEFPENYRDTYTQYTTVNRANGKQVAVLYANEPAIKSIKYGDQLVPGSKVVMEIYKFLKNDEGDPIKRADGIYEKGDLAAIAIMEKSIEWSNKFNSDHRSEEWGFAIYDPKGNIKKNDLDCASCHVSLTTNQDNIFTHIQLKESVK